MAILTVGFVLLSGFILKPIPAVAVTVGGECDSGTYELSYAFAGASSGGFYIVADGEKNELNELPANKDIDLGLDVKIIEGSQKYNDQGSLTGISLEWIIWHDYTKFAETPAIKNDIRNAEGSFQFSIRESTAGEFRQIDLSRENWLLDSVPLSGEELARSPYPDKPYRKVLNTIKTTHDNLCEFPGGEIEFRVGVGIPVYLQDVFQDGLNIELARSNLNGTFTININAGPSYISWHAYDSDGVGPKGAIDKQGATNDGADWTSGEFHSGQTFEVISHPTAPDGYGYAETPFGKGGWYYVKDGRKVYVTDAEGNAVYWTGGDPSSPGSYVREWNGSVVGGAIAARCGSNREVYFDFEVLPDPDPEPNPDPSPDPDPNPDPEPNPDPSPDPDPNPDPDPDPDPSPDPDPDPDPSPDPEDPDGPADPDGSGGSDGSKEPDGSDGPGAPGTSDGSGDSAALPSTGDPAVLATLLAVPGAVLLAVARRRR